MRAFAAVAVVAVLGCGGPAPGPVAVGTGREAAADRLRAADGGMPAVLDPLPPVPVLKDVPPELAKLFGERNGLHQRQAGARLTTTARWSPDPRLESHIAVDWAIDYAGPHRPFTVLKPSLGAVTVGGTKLWFWWEKAPGKVRWFRVQSAIAEQLLDLTRDDFAVAVGDKPVAGRLELRVWHLLQGGAGGRVRPGRRPARPTGHEPVWREPFDTGKPPLDAWTGELRSNVLKVRTADPE